MPTIKGTVKRQMNMAVVPGVAVELFLRLQNQVIKNLKANVDAEGRFAIAFDANSIPALINSKNMTVFAQVWQNGTESIPVANNPLIQNLELKDYDLDVLVNLPTVVTPPVPPGQFSVEGRVTDTSGVAAARLTVTAVDRDLRREEVLGSAITDANGKYQISYSSAQFTRAEKGHADLVVRVLGPDGKTELAKSDTLFNAPAHAEVSLTVPADKLHLDSEWERYHRELTPLLENILPQDLTDEDLQFLHGETGIVLLHLQLLRHAYRWLVEHRQHQLPTEAFYAVLRQRLSLDWPQLLQAGPIRWRAALKAAVEAKQVPQALSSQHDFVVKKLQELAVELTFSATEATSSTFVRPVGLLLSATGLAPQLQRQIAGLLLERNPGEDPQLWWKKLTDAGVPAQAVNTARFAIEADALLGGHVLTLQVLQTGVATSFGTAQELASLTRQQWQNVASKTAEGGGIPKEFKVVDAYAEALADQVESAFPTQTVMHRLRESPQLVRRDVGLFLSLNPGFNLLQSSVEESLDKANLKGIQTPKAELASQLKKEVAVARIVPDARRHEHMTLLLDKGYDSAAKIVLKGKGALRRDIVSMADAKAADEIYRKAKARASSAVLIATGLLNYLGPLIPVFPHIEPTGQLATWTELFASGNGCHCPACGSAHGPAAYLVALLEFLKDIDAQAPRGGDSLADVLQRRRPDLWHLKLNCANAETPLPYIDLVIEHLERLVATLPASALDYNERTTPQTRADLSVETLRAEPDLANSLVEIYMPSGQLQRARYPWQLPFDRLFERARIDFELLGTSAAEVLEAVGADEMSLALARSGLNQATWDLLHDVVMSDEAAVGAVWGFRVWNDELLTIGGPNGLLKRSGLEVAELYALLESLPWAGWRVAIDRDGDPCDVDRHDVKQRAESGGGLVDLVGATRTAVFDLLHRALRLRLRMGWSTSTLLTVMQALGVDAEHPAFDMVSVARLVALAKRLGLTPESLAQRMVVLRETSGDRGSSATRTARSQWLSLAEVSESEHADLTALGLPDLLADVTGAERLRRLEQMLQDRELIVEAGIEAAELRYLLQHVDLSPPVFALREEDINRYLEQIVAAIQAASATDGTTPPAGSTLVTRETGAAVQQLTEVTRFAFVAQVAGDQGSIPALVRAAAGAGSQDAVHIFIDLAGTPSDALRDHARIILLRIIKTCRLLELLRCTAEDVRLLAQLPRDGDRWVDFNALPVRDGDPRLTFNQIRGLLTASVVQASISAREPRLLAIMQTASADTAGPVAALTAWGRPIADPGLTGADALNTLAEALTLRPSEADTWRNPDTYQRLKRAVFWLQQRRLFAQDAQTLRTAVEAGLRTDELTMLVRRRFAIERDYFKALTPAMDRLRAQQRDALLGQILHSNRNGWATPADVYAHVLIDVQMGPCQLTSRLVQAHSAVQLFVQRCTQNLEIDAGVLLGDVSSITTWREWAWLKNYRVWEAARKVFLYPENWIEPDLRVGKSPFFEALENELLQDEIKPETVEKALRHYLVQMHEVSNLDILALFEEPYEEPLADGNTASCRVIHMVGRTRARPHVHYYRTRQDDLSWTPWEKIELSIDSDHLVLAVHNRRPMLFWPQWQEVQTNRNDPPTKAWDMTLNVSTREFGQWAAPQHCEGTFHFPGSERRTLTLNPRLTSEGGVELRIYLYALPPSETSRAVCISNSRYIGDACSAVFQFESIGGVRSYSDRELPAAMEPDAQGLRESLDGSRPAKLLRTDALSESALTAAEDVTFFNSPIDSLRLIPCQQYSQFNDQQPYVFQYQGRQLLAIRKTGPISIRLAGGFYLWLFPSRYVLEAVEHPFMCDLLEAIRSEGVDGLYRQGEWAPFRVVIPVGGARRHPRQLTVRNETWVETTLTPNTALVAKPYPVDEFDFSSVGAYALYNWELFFHVPLMLAEQLRKNQRHEEAQRWFHTIFDPTDVSPHQGPKKYWRVKPLFNDAQKWAGPAELLEVMLRRLWAGNADVAEQVEQWRKDPFNPHALASLRLVAYMKTVVQKYVENLIEWADSLFRRDTMESINEATQLYVLASHILGNRPVELPAHSPDAKSYAELSAPDSIDELGNALIDIESGLPFARGEGTASDEPSPGPSMLYFCIPSNPRLRELRATIDDRLFKIKHCMDVDGRLRQLALFAPPIDPALLVRARAAGLDIGTALSMALDARPPHYRFQPLLQKALEFTNEVRSFGGALLSALEKRDGEQLVQLGARHEVGMLKRVSEIKRQQIEEAEANLEATRKSKEVVQARLDFFAGNMQAFTSPSETAQIADLDRAHNAELTSAALSLGASIAYAFPDIALGLTSFVKVGGTNIGNALRAGASIASIAAQQHTFDASMAGFKASHERRADEWRHQVETAGRELAQIDQQIVAAEIRLAIAEQDQRNHESQIADAEEVFAMQRDKFTNAQLYSWMTGQLAALHYQSYRMAFDLAQQAAAAAHREVDSPTDIIRLDHWDAGRKGLLAGERLAQDLRRLEVAYMQANTRRFELTTHVSLRRLNALALLALRADDRCEFEIPPAVFRFDFPGHGSRRIKSVSISVPGVVGPYVGVHGVLKLVQPTDSMAACTAIATSAGQNDAGVFQLDFRDERYLPFEGVPLDEAPTAWEFTLPGTRGFDYNTISDVILHIQYTAKETASPGGSSPGTPTPPPVPPGTRYQLLDLRHDFPEAWRRLHEGSGSERVVLRDELFPYFVRVGTLTDLKLHRHPERIAETIGREFDISAADREGPWKGLLVVEYQLR